MVFNQTNKPLTVPKIPRGGNGKLLEGRGDSVGKEGDAVSQGIFF